MTTTPDASETTPLFSHMEPERRVLVLEALCLRLMKEHTKLTGPEKARYAFLRETLRALGN